MERTQIYARYFQDSDASLVISCPNCQQYIEDLKKLVAILNQKFSLLQIEDNETFECIKKNANIQYQKELIDIKKSFVSLRKRVAILQRENEDLSDENQLLLSQNRKLKNEGLKQVRQSDQIIEQNKKNQFDLTDSSTMISGENVAIKIEPNDSYAATKENKHKIWPSAKECDKTQESQDQNEYFQLLIEREKIQRQRNFEIQRLRQILL